jgi:hypothetical protein
MGDPIKYMGFSLGFKSWRGHLSMKSSPEKAGFFFSNKV